MYTISGMARRRTPESSEQNPNICIRLPAEEHARWNEVFRRARARNHLASKTDVARELLGLEEKNRLLTERDIAYFRGLKPNLRAVNDVKHSPQS